MSARIIVDGRRTGLKLDGVIPVFPNDLRHLQMHFLRGRHNDPVACRAYLLQRRRDAVILPLGRRQRLQKLQKLAVILDREAAFLRKHLIEELFREGQHAAQNAASEIDVADGEILHLLQLQKLSDRRLRLAEPRDVGCALPHRLIERRFERMLRRKRRDPSRQEEAKLRYRELIQQLREDSEDLLHRHRQAVDADRMDAVLLRKLLPGACAACPSGCSEFTSTRNGFPVAFMSVMARCSACT